MSVVAERERLVSDLVRLRRAERGSSALVRDDIAAVRADLENMAGPTVTRAVAARLLGVSQTALDRWIAGGDIPVLITRSGRREIPLRALVELVETVLERRMTEPNDRHPLGSVLRERRSTAERLSASTLLGTTDLRNRDRSGHRDAELRSLAYHRAVALRLDEDTIRDAEQRLARWCTLGRIDPRYVQQWEKILARTPSQIARLIGQDTPRMRDLRQSSPFAGALSEPERRRALAAVDEAPA
jgi:hypothetical protein